MCDDRGDCTDRTIAEARRELEAGGVVPKEKNGKCDTVADMRVLEQASLECATQEQAGVVTENGQSRMSEAEKGGAVDHSSQTDTCILDEDARARMFKLHLATTPHSLTAEDFAQLARMTEGFSGSRIAEVAQHAISEPVRKLRDAVFFKRVTVTERDQQCVRWTPCSPGDPDRVEMTTDSIKPNEIHVPSLCRYDLEMALSSH